MVTNSNSPRNNELNAPQECERCARLKSINAALLAACEANLDYQTGNHTSVDEIMALAEKCQRLTADAIAKAKGERTMWDDIPINIRKAL